jgi:biotin/methionine sulfoxide reductase
MTHERVPHTSHWGAFEAEVSDGTVVAIHPYRNDPDPSRLLGNIVDSLRHSARVTQPMIRAGWLDRGPGADARRGAEPFEPVSWPTAIGLLAGELRRVYDECGDAACTRTTSARPVQSSRLHSEQVLDRLHSVTVWVTTRRQRGMGVR